MRVYPIDPGAGRCHACHGGARWRVWVSKFRPELQLCERCARFLAELLDQRLAGVTSPSFSREKKMTD